MIKKFTLLLLVALSLVTTAKAKTVETTLWNDTYTDGVELKSATVATFKAGDVLRVYVTVPEGGANFKIVYKGDPDWSETTIPSINAQWLWVNGGDTYKDFTLTDADITALSGMNVYIYKGDNSTIDKVSLITEATGTTNISKDSYVADWTGKQYAAVKEAKIGDVLKFTYTATGTYFQIYVMNYARAETFENVAYGVTKDETYTYEYVIPDYTTLKKIREEGFSIKGADFTISSVDLLTYRDSYGYATITIGDTGYATWSSDKKYDFASAGITAYYASDVATGIVTLTPMDITWDWQGYILKADPDTYDVFESLTTDGTTYYPSKNYLKPNIDESDIAASVDGTYHYIFARHNSDIGFYKLTTAHTLVAHKAYLETTDDYTPGVSSSRGLTLDFGDGTTAIWNVKGDKIDTGNVREDGVYYTLQGTRVQNPSKGLYILNGKKVFIK